MGASGPLLSMYGSNQESTNISSVCSNTMIVCTNIHERVGGPR